MNTSEKLNLVLLCGVFVGTTCGYTFGRMSMEREPIVSQLPSNWDPVKADTAASLRAAQESLTRCYGVVNELATKGVAH